MTECGSESDNEALSDISPETRFVFSLLQQQIKQNLVKSKCIKV
jgi:hypothetical protein